MLTIKAEAQTSALAVADSLYAVGEHDQAIEKLEAVAPKSEVVYLKLAKVYNANRNAEAALSNYREVLDQNPKRLLTAIEYGKLLVKTGSLEKADSLFAELSEKYPENANFYYQRGIIKEKQQDSTARDFFLRSLSYDMTHQGALYKIAKEELKHRRYTMAEHYSKKGLETNPGNVSLLSILAQTYSSIKEYREAIPHYEKLLELGQESEFIYSKLGYANYQLFDYKRAILYYNKALEFEDRNAATHFILGKLYAQTGDLEKSETHLLMAILIKKQPVDAEFLSLGLTYKLQKEYKEALDYFDKALEENPDNQRALYEKAVAADNYYEDKELVLQHYNTYLRKYEENGNPGMLSLTRNRIKDIKKKLHLEE
ncbi:tetratricopeptide repeat protein [Salegentibacter sp.]|uniref:tetratricopeptide repeat protein n=1 Tax=Salegentibacter sp. TaxID=1903072 RepID=UPI00356AB0C2